VATRNLNKVQLIGNLTRDPELRYTPQGTAVCTFGVATSRQWVPEGGERREETEFHRIVSWNKLAELCAQFLAKGRRVYVEGRLQTRNWTAQDGSQRQTVEIVINDMIILDSKRVGEEGVVTGEGLVPKRELPSEEIEAKEAVGAGEQSGVKIAPQTTPKGKKKQQQDEEKTSEPQTEEIQKEDIPF